MKEANLTYASAESITGGRIQAHFTKLNGSSNYFRGGLCAYATDVKVSALGVTKDVAEKHNSVCEQTAREMTEGCYKIFGADVSIATTGYVQSFEWDGVQYNAKFHSAIRLSEKVTGDKPIVIHKEFKLDKEADRQSNSELTMKLVLEFIDKTLKDYGIEEKRVSF